MNQDYIITHPCLRTISVLSLHLSPGVQAVSFLKVVESRSCMHFSSIPVIYPAHHSHIIFLSFGATAPTGAGPSHSRGVYIIENATPQLVGLLWTSDQLVAETLTYNT
jgi:hypothetical protein